MPYTNFADTLLRKNQILCEKPDRAPLRILHVVGGMNRGGVETWLMHVLRHIERDRFQIDFLVHTDQPCAYDEEIRALGSQIIPCLDPSKPWLYASNFKGILREYGPYDIVHSHVHHFSGYVMYLAKQLGIPIRIAHSHNDTSALEAKAPWHRRLYLALTKKWIARDATMGLGCSHQAAANLFGSNWQRDRRWRIFYCGIDLTKFNNVVDSAAVRAEFGIPADAFTIGHVGRFQEQKNHKFLIEIAAEVAKREPKMRFLLMGDGPLRSQVEQKVKQMGLANQIIFAGVQPQIPRLMLGAMDVFLLPSLHEGLPVVGLEAQAAGLPFILSDVITEEVDLVKPLIHRISLSQPASVWANTILSLRNTVSNITPAHSLALLENSKFNIACSINSLTKIYTDEYSKSDESR